MSNLLRGRALRNISVVCLAFIALQTVSASPLDPTPGKRVSFVGAGATSCKDMLSNPAIAGAQLEWALGYISAVNAYVWPDGKLQGNLDENAIKLELTTICRSAPSSDIVSAVTTLLFQLENRPAKGRAG